MAVKKIILKGEDLCIRKEGIAGETITPGDFVTDVPGGTINDQTGSTANDQPCAIAYENEVVGNEIGDNYAQYDTILYAVCPRGVEVYLNGAAAISAGDVLEVGASGAVQTQTTGFGRAIALETITAAGRIKATLL